jgi:hypothetical protein
MKTQTTEPDPVINEVREARHRISARHGHDPRRLVDHYIQRQLRDPASVGKADQVPEGGLTVGCSGPDAQVAEPGR